MIPGAGTDRICARKPVAILSGREGGKVEAVRPLGIEAKEHPVAWRFDNARKGAIAVRVGPDPGSKGDLIGVGRGKGGHISRAVKMQRVGEIAAGEESTVDGGRAAIAGGIGCSAAAG